MPSPSSIGGRWRWAKTGPVLSMSATNIQVGARAIYPPPSNARALDQSAHRKDRAAPHRSANPFGCPPKSTETRLIASGLPWFRCLLDVWSSGERPRSSCSAPRPFTAGHYHRARSITSRERPRSRTAASAEPHLWSRLMNRNWARNLILTIPAIGFGYTALALGTVVLTCCSGERHLRAASGER